MDWLQNWSAAVLTVSSLLQAIGTIVSAILAYFIWRSNQASAKSTQAMFDLQKQIEGGNSPRVAFWVEGNVNQESRRVIVAVNIGRVAFCAKAVKVKKNTTAPSSFIDVHLMTKIDWPKTLFLNLIKS